MSLMKVTFIFEARNKGWTESYYKTFSNPDPGAAKGDAMGLATKRMGVAGLEVLMTYIRIQNVDTLRRVRLFWLETTMPGVLSKPSDNPESALIVKYNDITGGRAKTTFMRGYWDQVVDFGGQYIPTVAFTNALESFFDNLRLQNWGWNGINTQTTQPLATLVQDLSGTVSGTTVGNVFTAPQVGTTIAVRFKRITQPGNLNGQNPVVVTAQNAFKTVKRIAILPWSGDGFVTASAKQIVLINEGEVTGVSERKTGRVFGSPRGRLPARRRA